MCSSSVIGPTAARGTQTVAAPGLLEDKAYGSESGETVFGYVRSMINQLKGDAGKNKVENSKIVGLQATNPIKATRQRTKST
jgi:hypothetical protein